MTTCAYKSSNEYRHKSSLSLYAHYSMVDDYNFDVFPNLRLATPIHFTLQSGQSLYIPKKWWHWVKTTKKTFAVNYWFDNQIDQEPFIFEHTIHYDTNLLNDEIVSIWNSQKNGGQAYMYNFKDFYNSKLNDKALITLSNYKSGGDNHHIKKKLFDHITFPVHKKIISNNLYDYNIWASSNMHDTGLHYDDEDGVLTVVEGEKDIILFPPSDAKYLYPYKVFYEWKEAEPLEFRYNTSEKKGRLDGISSGELLYVTCNHDKQVLSNISKLYEKYKHNHKNLIWGFKKIDDDYRWEIYNDTLNQEDIKITSWDIYPNKYDISNNEHYYYKIDDGANPDCRPNQLPFWGYGKYIIDGIFNDESKIFVIDSYENFYKNYDEYMIKLNYESIKEKFKNIILKKYNCYNICVHNKNLNEIFVQYLGLKKEKFLEFLIENRYPTYIINFVSEQIEKNRYKINNEITIVYDANTQKIIRSGFYGNL